MLLPLTPRFAPVTQCPTSGWDIATAVGTILAAVATVGAIIAALWTAARDRRAALDLAREDRQAAEVALQEQIDSSLKRDSIEREVDLLLALAEKIAALSLGTNYSNAPQHALHARTIALALPDLVAMPAIRQLLIAEVNFVDLPTLNDIHRGGEQGRSLEQLAATEIADRIKRITGLSQIS